MSSSRDFVKTDILGKWLQFKILRSQCNTLPDIVLMPMSHVADKEFYCEVDNWIAKCDVVLVEGAHGKLGKIAGLVYRILAGSKKLGLAGQKNHGATTSKNKSCTWEVGAWTQLQPDTPREKRLAYVCTCGECQERVIRYIHADLSRDKTQKALARLPFWVWPMAFLFGVGGALWLSLFGDRDDFTSTTDHKNDIFQEWLDRPTTSWQYMLAHYMITLRDNRLIEILNTEIFKTDQADEIIGVKYGAHHLYAVEKYLIETIGYRIEQADWLMTICALDAPSKNTVETINNHKLRATVGSESTIFD